MKKLTQQTLANAGQRTLALFAVATLVTVPAVAANRAPRLHAATHAAGHVIATRSYATPTHGRHNAHAEAAEARPAKHGKKSAAADKERGELTRSYSKDGRHKRHEREAVDEPVVMHRAGAHKHPLTRRERLQELARERQEELEEARYEAAHRVTKRPAVRTPVVVEAAAVRETEPTDSQYSSREFKASYDNVARAVEKNGRPNVFSRTHGAEIGDALRPTTAHGKASNGASTDPEEEPISGQGRPSSVVVRRPVAPAQISASDSPIDPAQHYQPRVATGFGAEVAPLPKSSARAAMSATLSTEAQDLGEDLAADSLPSPHTLANDAMQPLVTPMYNREGSLLMPAPLRGSHEILVHQNVMADHDGLERIRDDGQLNRLRAEHLLVSFPETSSLRVNEGLPENRRYARPWTVQFATDAARAFYQRFGEPLQVNSAVRTVSYQLRLQRVNGNAAATRGEGASPHLTGQAIDLAKRGMTAEEIGWMRGYLLPFIDAGKVDVEEEFQQACFHISVYRSYLPVPRRPTMQVAQVRALVPTAVTSLRENSDNDR